MGLFAVNKLLGVVAIVALIFVAKSFLLKREITRLEEQLKETQEQIVLSKARLEISSADLLSCQANINLQNTKIELLKAQVDEERVKKGVSEKFKSMQVPLNNPTCQKKLKFYEELFNEANK